PDDALRHPTVRQPTAARFRAPHAAAALPARNTDGIRPPATPWHRTNGRALARKPLRNRTRPLPRPTAPDRVARVRPVTVASPSANHAIRCGAVHPPVRLDIVTSSLPSPGVVLRYRVR